MATSKTLNPTNVSISIPALGDAPDASVFSNCIDKEADAINALNSQLIPTAITGSGDFNSYTGTTDGKTTLYAGSNIAQMSNRPSSLGSSQWPYHLYVRQIGGYIQQILFAYSTTDSPANVFFRNQTYVNGSKVWASWAQMAITDQFAKTTGSGTATNQYGTASYSYNVRAGVCTVFVDYTPSTNITTSSGALALSNIPMPSTSCISATYSEAQLGTSFGAAVLDNQRYCRFLGARTSGVEFFTSFTYVVN